MTERSGSGSARAPKVDGGDRPGAREDQGSETFALRVQEALDAIHEASGVPIEWDTLGERVAEHMGEPHLRRLPNLILVKMRVATNRDLACDGGPQPDDSLRKAIEAAYADDPRVLYLRNLLDEPFQSEDYAEAAGVTVQGGNNSLRWLYRHAMVARRRDDPPAGGKRFEYVATAAARLALRDGAPER